MKTVDAAKLRKGDYVTVKNYAGYWYVECPLADGVLHLRTVHSRLVCTPRYIDMCVTQDFIATK